MNWLKKSHTSRPAATRRNSIRPVLEGLDDRIVPAVTYHGGPVIPHVEVQNVFYGQGWNSDTWGIGRYVLNKFQSDITQSPYMAMLGEYGVGRGHFGGYDTVAGASSPADYTTVQEGTIQNMLASEIVGGRLPEENGQRLYFVYLPANVASQFDVDHGFLGHHRSFQMQMPHTINLGFTQFTYYTTDTVYYAVIPNPVGNATWPGLNSFQQQTKVSSHELAEAVTNPDLSGGWWDSDRYIYIHSPLGWYATPNPHYGDEIGDYANNDVVSFVANGTTYTVQKEWSAYLGYSIIARGNSEWWLNQPTSGWPFTHTWSYGVQFNNGPAETLHRGIGVDGAFYMNWEISPGDYSGWFTLA
jgi:hypothetical protein